MASPSWITALQSRITLKHARRQARESRPHRVRSLRVDGLEDRLAPAVSPLGPEFRVNTTIASDQLVFPESNHAVARDADGDFVVTWGGNQPGSTSWDVYAQRYSASGTPLGGEFRVNTFTGSDQYPPAVAMDADGDFVIAWSSIGQDGSGWGVYARRYAADGTPRGGEFRVNTFTLNDQRFPLSVAMDADG